MSLPLSICLIVRDEVDMLPRCLESLRGLGTELIVIDTGSTDQTSEIATRLGAQVTHAAWEHDFATVRNKAVSLATQPWILMLDADEIVDELAGQALRALVPTADPHAIYLFQCFDASSASWTYKPYLFANDARLQFKGRVFADLLPTVPGYRQEVLDAIRIQHRFQERPAAKRENLRTYFIDLLRRRLEDDPADASPMLHLSRMHLDAGEYAESLAMAEQAVEELPDGTDLRLMAYFYGALANYRKKAWEDACEHARTAVALYRDYTELHALLGLANLALGELAQAEESLATAVYLARRPVQVPLPGFAEFRPPVLLEALGRAFEGQGKLQPASICRKLSNANPAEATNLLFHELTGMLRHKQWSSALWLVTLFLPVEISDAAGGLLRSLEGPYAVERFLAEAELWSTVQGLGKTSPMPRRLLIYAAQHFPLDARPLQRLGQIALNEENWNEAVDFLNQALHLDGRSGWSWNALGIASIMVGDQGKARTCFETALQVGNPQEAEGAHKNLAKLTQPV
ncbi:MAG: glycosyltransferase [Candidatus Sericytochromatia bacterium]|nr:glycosyltransferase [Candidatus Sericytochromatia bacterium]